MGQMKNDMSNVWGDFTKNVNEALKEVISSIRNILDGVIDLTAPPNEDPEPDEGNHKSAIKDLHDTLQNRREIIIYGIEEEMVKFRPKLAKLKTDSLGPMRTAFIGQFMENAYVEANKQGGELLPLPPFHPPPPKQSSPSTR
jgi:hypothetical protein